MSLCPYCDSTSLIRATMRVRRSDGQPHDVGLLLDTNYRVTCYQLISTDPENPVVKKIKAYADHTHTCPKWPQDVERGSRVHAMQEIQFRNCRECGKRIIWATNQATGRRIPLCGVTPVYTFDAEQGAQEALGAFTSHFATCPNVGAVKARQAEGARR